MAMLRIPLRMDVCKSIGNAFYKMYPKEHIYGVKKYSALINKYLISDTLVLRMTGMPRSATFFSPG